MLLSINVYIMCLAISLVKKYTKQFGKIQLLSRIYKQKMPFYFLFFNLRNTFEIERNTLCIPKRQAVYYP